MSVNLQVRSSYTLLSSTIKIDELINKCLTDNIKSISIVDKNVMHSAIQFYNACIANHINPILGLEIEAEYKTKIYGYIIIAKNNEGYSKLIKLSTKINTNSATINVAELVTLAEDCVIILTTPLNIINNQQELIQYLKDHKQLSNMYCGINSNDLEFNRKQNMILKETCKALDIKTVAISPTYYLKKEDSDAYETCIAIKKGMKLSDQQLDIEKNRYFRNEEEMEKLYDKNDLEATEEIAKLCSYSLPLKKAELPVYKNKLNIGSEEYLSKLCKKGLIKRLKTEEPSATYIARLNYELQVINQMKFADYFLIVYDFIRYARSNDIYVGPGRGSAAGSLVAYCLGITHVDPIKYNLLFERFLNPERISMPDIDTDFPDNRREEVIEYVRKTYGEVNVAHIITFGTFGAKQAIRDVGKAMSLPSYEIDKLAQAIPNLIKVNLMYAYNNSKAFKILIDGNERNRQLLRIALKIEGLPRHASTHAGGIVISRHAIDNYCPLISVEEGIVSTQYPMEYLENLGLIKMDFLGLRNLTIIDEIVSKIKKENAEFDIMNIPLNDKKTFELIQDTNTVGVFQLESDGMKNLIHKMKPNCFDDIVATIALYRPGPMQNIPTFLEARNNKNKIEYLHPKLKEILEPTYGVIIYQEQIMQIAQVMGGFTLGKADILRKAISKKKSNQ
ncbi:MAG: DNA polymerase III subunit alpha, partial [Erysipelotrichaceae bacterium]